MREIGYYWIRYKSFSHKPKVALWCKDIWTVCGFKELISDNEIIVLSKRLIYEESIE